jgi:hypothetical protein
MYHDEHMLKLFLGIPQEQIDHDLEHADSNFAANSAELKVTGSDFLYQVL